MCEFRDKLLNVERKGITEEGFKLLMTDNSKVLKNALKNPFAGYLVEKMAEFDKNQMIIDTLMCSKECPCYDDYEPEY